MDLNLNPDAIDIYTLTINTDNTPPASFRGLADLIIKVNGNAKVVLAQLHLQLYSLLKLVTIQVYSEESLV